MLTFLAGKKPLTKQFKKVDGVFETISFQMQYELTSTIYKEPITIDFLYDKIKEHAAKGHALLKGNLTKSIIAQSRKGLCKKNDPTYWICLDFDSLHESVDIMALLRRMKITCSYILQLSASHTITKAKAYHVFFVLPHSVLPTLLKILLSYFNTTFFATSACLDITKRGLCYPLDTCTWSNGRLIYIAPPIFVAPCSDPFSLNDRIILVRGASDYYTMPSIPYSRIEREETQRINSHRKELGLSRVTAKTKPAKAIVTSVEVDDEYTRVNLNGGDSNGYWHWTKNPQMLYSFKDDFVEILLSEIVPDYWESLNERGYDDRTDKQILGGRDSQSQHYIDGFYDETRETLHIRPASSKSQVQDHYKSFCMNPPNPLPNYKIIYDPKKPAYDKGRSIVNYYKAPELERIIKTNRYPNATIPPTIRKTILHVLGLTEQAILIEESQSFNLWWHFINHLAYIVQERDKSQIAYVLIGCQGSGKNTLLSKIIAPLVGESNVFMLQTAEAVEQQFNKFVSRCIVLGIDEVHTKDFRRKELVTNKIKAWITEKKITVRGMREEHDQKRSFFNVYLLSNYRTAISIPRDDRRFVVSFYQQNKLVVDHTRFAEEITEFYAYITRVIVSKKHAKSAIMTSSKIEIIENSQTSFQEVANQLISGNFDYFYMHWPDDDFHLYNEVPPYIVDQYKLVVTNIFKEPTKKQKLTIHEVYILFAFFNPTMQKNNRLKGRFVQAGLHWVTDIPVPDNPIAAQGIQISKWYIKANITIEKEK